MSERDAAGAAVLRARKQDYGLQTSTPGGRFAGGITVDYPNSTKAKKFYLCLSFERTYQVPQGLDDAAMIATAHANSHTQQQNMIVSRSSSGSRKGKAKKAAFKSKEWIVAKKSRMQMQGKVTKTDSKYTGRKRKSRF